MDSYNERGQRGIEENRRERERVGGDHIRLRRQRDGGGKVERERKERETKCRAKSRLARKKGCERNEKAEGKVGRTTTSSVLVTSHMLNITVNHFP